MPNRCPHLVVNGDKIINDKIRCGECAKDPKLQFELHIHLMKLPKKPSPRELEDYYRRPNYPTREVEDA